MRDGMPPPFDCAPGLRLAAHERLMQLQLEHLNRRLERIEQMMERLERRLWFAVYGVAAVVLGQTLRSLMLLQ
ncbi:hypothetical protein DL239_11630 [Sedimentitalea sp. CY04]|uniref:Gene transfer agent protein n=1 Tax=Parasedimentitalea denitrificans TaxID=2211118 RepID=A0ABX0WAD2_9RHOB|nr:hypothetical protein [Sedimentitalea sp. CY04]NIZ61625.1 hypothetical protein [Sedimentitalea sp. CY04]